MPWQIAGLYVSLEWTLICANHNTIHAPGKRVSRALTRKGIKDATAKAGGTNNCSGAFLHSNKEALPVTSKTCLSMSVIPLNSVSSGIFKRLNTGDAIVTHNLHLPYTFLSSTHPKWNYLVLIQINAHYCSCPLFSWQFRIWMCRRGWRQS